VIQDLFLFLSDTCATSAKVSKTELGDIQLQVKEHTSQY